MGKIVDFFDLYTRRLFDKEAIRNYKLKKGKQMSDENCCKESCCKESCQEQIQEAIEQEVQAPQEPSAQDVLNAKIGHLQQIEGAIKQRQQQYLDSVTNMSMSYALKLLETKPELSVEQTVSSALEYALVHIETASKKAKDLEIKAPLPQALLDAKKRVEEEVEQLKKEVANK